VLETAGFVRSNHPYQTVHISVNGNEVKTVQYDLQNITRQIHVPLPVDGSDHATISFQTPTAISPTQLGMLADNRLLGINLKRVVLSYLQKIEQLGHIGTSPYTMVGFSGGEGTHRWTEADRAEIEIPLGEDLLNRPNMVSFLNTASYVTPGHSQVIRVLLNGDLMKELNYTTQNNDQRIDVVIPQNSVNPARIEFKCPNAMSPGPLDGRKLGLSVNQMLTSYQPRT
jgi:hypothetical protein